jgi:aspartate aminotransferase
MRKKIVAAFFVSLIFVASSFSLPINEYMLYNGLKDKFDIIRPGGAFYAFVGAPSGSATKFVEKAIANNVLVIPGNVFSEKDTHFRISYATSDDKILRGIEILRKLV